MLFLVFFTDRGTPQTGLTPDVDVWETDGTQVVTTAAMSEIGGGWYSYDFAGYDDTKDYVSRADGGSSLPGLDRYKQGTTSLPALVPDVADAVWDEPATSHQTLANMGAVYTLLVGKQITNPATGVNTIRTLGDGADFATADIFEDVAETQRYQDQGINVRDELA